MIETTRIALAELQRDGGTQPRSYTDGSKIAEYAELMRAGVEFPPLQVVFDGAQYWLVDGFHRAEAAERAELTDFACEVTQGTLEQAQWMSYGVNATHGLPRTNWDKRRAVAAALNHALSKDLSDRAIAQHVGCDHKTVGSVRRELVASGEVPQSATRIGSDGRVVQVPPAPPWREKQEPAPPVAEPDGGWPEPDEQGRYNEEAAEILLGDGGRHSQARIAVLQVQQCSWREGEAWIAEYSAVLPGHDTGPRPLTDDLPLAESREAAIANAAHDLAVWLLRLQSEWELSKPVKKQAAELLAWAEQHGAVKVDAELELQRLRDAEALRLKGDAEDVISSMRVLLDPGYRRIPNYDWGQLFGTIRSMPAEWLNQWDEGKAVIEQIDLVAERFEALRQAILERREKGGLDVAA
jgi:hypothetical protein